MKRQYLILFTLLFSFFTQIVSGQNKPCNNFDCAYKKAETFLKQAAYQKALDNLDSAEGYLTDTNTKEKEQIKGLRRRLFVAIEKEKEDAKKARDESRRLNDSLRLGKERLELVNGISINLLENMRMVVRLIINKEDYIISEKYIIDHPDIILYIMMSTSIVTKKDKQYWFDILPSLDEVGLNKLKNIQSSEFKSLNGLIELTNFLNQIYYKIQTTNDKNQRYTFYSILIDSISSYTQNGKLLNSTLKQELAQTYGNKAWNCMFVKKFAEAEESARKGLEIDSSKVFIRLNLGHSLIFQGKYHDGLLLYQYFLDTPQQFKNKTNFETIKNDLQELSEFGINPPNLNELMIDLEKIRKK